MKLRYRLAVISFCPDLTSSDAQSVPVGALLLGRSDIGGVAAVLSLATPLPGVDPISAELLGQLMRIVRDHVDDHLRESEGYVDVDGVLRSLEHSLRNSLHVSSISDEVEIDAATDAPTLNIDAVRHVTEHFLIAVRTFKAARAEDTPYLLEPDADFFDPAVTAWPLIARRRDSHA